MLLKNRSVIVTNQKFSVLIWPVIFFICLAVKNKILHQFPARPSSISWHKLTSSKTALWVAFENLFFAHNRAEGRSLQTRTLAKLTHLKQFTSQSIKKRGESHGATKCSIHVTAQFVSCVIMFYLSLTATQLTQCVITLCWLLIQVTVLECYNR